MNRSRRAPFLAAAAVFATTVTLSAHAADEVAIQKGHDVFQYWCTACHGDGPTRPGTTALQVKYNGTKPAMLEARKDLTPELVRFFVRNGVNVMPPFRKTEITDADLNALAAYLSRKRR